MWKVRNTAAILSLNLIYSKQSFMQICYKSNERRAFFFVCSCFESSHAETDLRGEHIAPVRSCSGQQSASVVRCISLHPPIHPSGWHAHIVTRWQEKHTNTLSEKHPMNHDKLPFEGALFTRPLRVSRRNGTRVCFSHINLRAVKKDGEPRSVQLSGFVNAARLNMGTRSIEHTLSWVSERVCVGFFLLMLLFSYRVAFQASGRPFFTLKQTRTPICSEQSK